MLIEKTSKYSLQTQWSKVLKIMPALKSSFVLLTVDKPGREELILHVDASGKELYRHSGKDTINFITMINDRTVAYCAIEESKIVLINLEKQTKGGIDHDFMSNCSASVNIDFFPETRMIVLMERGEFEEHRLRLTYFGEQGDGKVLAEYNTLEGQFRHQDLVTKGNSHSMVIWAKNSFQESITLWVYDLRGEAVEPREPRCIRVDSTAPFVTGQVMLSLVNVWECRPDCFLLACNSNLERKDPARANNTNYILDTRTGLFGESRFAFDGLDNERLIDQQNFGSYSLYPTFDYKAGSAVTSPVYIVSNEDEVVVGKVTWRSESTFNWYPVDYDLNSLLLAEFPAGDVKEISVKHYKVIEPKDVYMRFMLHLCADLDDDLLMEAIGLLQQ